MRGKVTETADRMTHSFRTQSFKNNGWGQRHFDAWFSPRPDQEAGMVVTMKGLATYADGHEQMHGSPIGADGVLGPYWLGSLVSLMRLRDGAHGRLDAGALGDTARAMAEAAGFDAEELEEIG